MNLQNARAVANQANQAVNLLLQSKSSSLPYAVGVSTTTNPLIGQTIINPNVSISNWFNYISANFGKLSSVYSNMPINELYGLGS